MVTAAVRAGPGQGSAAAGSGSSSSVMGASPSPDWPSHLLQRESRDSSSERKPLEMLHEPPQTEARSLLSICSVLPSSPTTDSCLFPKRTCGEIWRPYVAVLEGAEPWASLGTTGTCAARPGARESPIARSNNLSWDALLPTRRLAPATHTQCKCRKAKRTEP
ncbi:hypothetical protein QTO34_017738 [Cnephaeus nilssonii]|uniref:Uncharacterized protein n=1 Tax=Cnephaeus nilssonii TaxID=3371016 RepID=A0AA40I1P5_CNENI|nr:hypothetical protein QTO34_017738 [Eptesicus nilssonii]